MSREIVFLKNFKDKRLISTIPGKRLLSQIVRISNNLFFFFFSFQIRFYIAEYSLLSRANVQSIAMTSFYSVRRITVNFGMSSNPHRPHA